jgi:hypothetical protein
MRWTEQKARMLYGIELRSCRVRFAFTAGMGPDTWVESNTGSRRDQLSCPNSPARRQRIVYKYPVTPPPSFFEAAPSFVSSIFSSLAQRSFRTVSLSQSVQSLPRVVDLTPMATICLQQQEMDRFPFALPSKTPPLEGFSSDNEEISDFGDGDGDLLSVKKILAGAENRQPQKWPPESVIDLTYESDNGDDNTVVSPPPP